QTVSSVLDFTTSGCPSTVVADVVDLIPAASGGSGASNSGRVVASNPESAQDVAIIAESSEVSDSKSNMNNVAPQTVSELETEESEVTNPVPWIIGVFGILLLIAYLTYRRVKANHG
ncbi:MAG: hypothetical protein ABIR91_04370, partial [Candidatus Saccharimonadales bacterium]